MDDAGYVLLVMGLVGLLVSIGLNVFLVQPEVWSRADQVVSFDDGRVSEGVANA